MSSRNRSQRARSRARLSLACNNITESLESRVLFAEVAGTLLVSVNATNLVDGAAATNIPNTGTLGGVFGNTTGDATQVPVVGKPVANATGGTVGIRMDGTDFLRLLTADLSAPINAPAEITGVDATSSVEAWVWNPGIAQEETVLAWGKRGGNPDGSNMSFNYGNDAAWGAVGRWGGQDIGWGPTVPVARQWHHIAYTYDGTTSRVYADGVLVNSEVLTPGAINVHPDTPILLGAQTQGDGVTIEPALRGSLTIGRARVHDGVLTDAQIQANYNAEKAEFVEPTIPTPTPTLVKLVDVNPTTVPAGSPVNDLPNSGTLGGVFRGNGGADQTPTAGVPVAGASGGTTGAAFDGNDYLQLVDAGGTLITAPASITGTAVTTTIEAWVWNPTLAGEETILSWGKRGGPDGTNMSFNYGSNADYGAMGHWGSPDLGWGTNPAAKHWHHLVYTYDGITQKVYSDGVQTNQEVLGEGVLNIAAGTAITLGAQLQGDGSTVTPELRGTLTLGRTRIYSGAMTADMVLANYNAEKASYVEPILPPPPDPTPLTDGPSHRYTFANTSGDATAGVIEDTVGDLDGNVLGGGATFTGSRLSLPGGSPDTAPYVDLPNGMLSSHSTSNGGNGEITIEGWARTTGAQNWGRYFDFGYSTGGEFFGPGGAGNGTAYFMYSSSAGLDTGTHRFEMTPGGTANRTIDVASPTFNTDLHYAITWNETTGQIRIFENGLEVDSTITPASMGSFPDFNNFLGRSNFTQDGNFQGEFDEFRIYDRVLTPGEIRGNFNAGADTVNVVGANPVLSSIAVNNGDAQRSQVTSLKLTFDRAVTLAPGAATLQLLNTGGSGLNNGSGPTDASLALGAPTTVDNITYTYTFAAGAFTETAGSLKDGVYTLNVDPTKVTASGQAMLTPGTLTFHRLFGDFNGSKNVNNADYIQFRTTFGKATGNPAYIPAFDFDSGGLVNNADYIQFRNRFGKAFTY